MKTNTKHSHRGDRLLQIVNESGVAVTQLMKKVGLSRSSYYNHVTDPELPLDILLKYGKVLRHDFLEDFPDVVGKGNKVAEAENSYTALSHASTLPEAERQRDIWKDKYFELLDKYHALKERIDKENELDNNKQSQ